MLVAAGSSINLVLRWIFQGMMFSPSRRLYYRYIYSYKLLYIYPRPEGDGQRSVERIQAYLCPSVGREGTGYTNFYFFLTFRRAQVMLTFTFFHFHFKEGTGYTHFYFVLTFTFRRAQLILTFIFFLTFTFRRAQVILTLLFSHFHF